MRGVSRARSCAPNKSHVTPRAHATSTKRFTRSPRTTPPSSASSTRDARTHEPKFPEPARAKDQQLRRQRDRGWAGQGQRTEHEDLPGLLDGLRGGRHLECDTSGRGESEGSMWGSAAPAGKGKLAAAIGAVHVRVGPTLALFPVDLCARLDDGPGFRLAARERQGGWTVRRSCLAARSTLGLALPRSRCHSHKCVRGCPRSHHRSTLPPARLDPLRRLCFSLLLAPHLWRIGRIGRARWR